MTSTAQKLAATKGRNFRTFLLMQQFAADEIGARIAQARKERGLTQEQLAGMASFSQRSLQDYERGVTIPYRHMRELAKLLRRPEEWFLYGDPEPAERTDPPAIRAPVVEVAELLTLLDRATPEEIAARQPKVAELANVMRLAALLAGELADELADRASLDTDRRALDT